MTWSGRLPWGGSRSLEECEKEGREGCLCRGRRMCKAGRPETGWTVGLKSVLGSVFFVLVTVFCRPVIDLYKFE